MLSIVRTDLAESDLAEILDYLDERSPRAAERLASAFDEGFNLLAQFPEIGRAREDLASGVRSFVVDHYVLFYRVTETTVEVLRILHGARDIEAFKKTD